MYAAIKLSLNNSTREADILSHACGRMSASLVSLPLGSVTVPMGYNGPLVKTTFK